MSTKTAFKRVALVAAAALAIGGFSAVAAQASQTLTVAGTPALSGSNTGYTASPVTGTYVSLAITGVADHSITITTAGVGTIYNPGTAPTSSTLSGNLWYAGTTVPGAGIFSTANAGNAVGSLTISAFSAVAGTQTISLVGDVGGTTTVTLTWGAAPVVSAGNSLVVPNSAADITAAGAVYTLATHGVTPTAGLQITAATADTGLSQNDTIGTTAPVGAFVELFNNASTPVPVTSDVISASVAGPGTLTIQGASATPTNGAATAVAPSGAAVTGRSVSEPAGTDAAVIKVASDGTAGTSTVTISDSTAGVVIGTFTVTFYSTTIAKLVATTNTTVPLAAVTGFESADSEGFTGANAPTGTDVAPVSVVADDANGNAIPNQVSEIAVSSGTTTVATVSATPSWDSTGDFYYPTINPLSEGKTVLTFTDVSTGLVIATATVWVVPAVVATLTAATDNSSYDPGTKVLYTLTAADAAGNPVADGTYVGLLTTVPTSNVGLQGSLPTAATANAAEGTSAQTINGEANVTFAGGVATYTLYAPLATANVAIAGGVINSGGVLTSSALEGATVNEADFSTTGSSDDAANAATDAANEATDAANAATDAANAAADSADAATQAAQDADTQAQAALAAVTALSQQVTTLLAKVASLSASVAKILKAVSKK